MIRRVVLGHHWKSKLVSIFTCVATTEQGTLSFGVVSDDIVHGFFHTLFALNVVEGRLEEALPIFKQLVYILDGALSHFENRHQVYKFKKECRRQVDIVRIRAREKLV
ncbi:hypothetical protein ANAPC5_01337 [Anaplasma phagocytophilum]|nr:hypothetical protein ANAPC5_01337 [Anaplasma phagocytophilum]